MGMRYQVYFFWVLLLLEELTRSVRAWTAFKSTGHRLQLLKVYNHSVRQICRNAKTSHSCTARDDDRQCNAQSRGCMHARLKIVLSFQSALLNPAYPGRPARQETCRNHKSEHASGIACSRRTWLHQCTQEMTARRVKMSTEALLTCPITLIQGDQCFHQIHGCIYTAMGMSKKKLRKKRRPSGPSSRHNTPVFSAVSKCSEAIGKGTVRADATSLAVTAGPKPSSAATSCPILAHTCMCLRMVSLGK